jgi:hypothetical protein
MVFEALTGSGLGDLDRFFGQVEIHFFQFGVGDAGHLKFYLLFHIY